MERVRPKVVFTSPSLCQRQFAADTDVNVLIQRCLSGDASSLAQGRPSYVDASNSPDSFHDAMNKVARSNSLWESIPEQVRATYGSPEGLLNAIERENVLRSRTGVPKGEGTVEAAKAKSSEVTPSEQPG